MKTHSIAKFTLTLSLAVWLVLSPSAPAQDNGRRNAQIQLQQRQRITPSLREIQSRTNEEEESDLGVISLLKPAKKWFVTPYASARGFWTSNALLTNGKEVGDAIFMANQGVVAGYQILPEWRWQAGYNYQLTRYDENPALDVDAHSPEVSTTVRLPYGFEVQPGMRGLWMNSTQQGVEIYREANPFVLLVNQQPFLDGRLVWFGGYQFDQKFANPVSFDRQEHTAFTGVGYSWLDNLATTLTLRQNWQFYDFTSPFVTDKREEWISSVGFQTVWQPLPWLQVTAFGILTYDNSINAVRDYKSADLGGEVRAFWNF